MITLIGSYAAKQWFEDFRTPKDMDFHSPNPCVVHTLNGEPRLDVFTDERLGAWDWGRVATPEELYTMKVSHAFWEINHDTSNWNKHMADIIFFQRKGVKFNRELYEVLKPIWKELHGKKITSLNQGVAFDAIERWKPYPHNSKYEVSNFGRLRGPRGVTEGAVCTAHKGMYRQFSIGGKTILSHKVVAETWIGPRPVDKEIRHLDGNGHNNRVLNLAYGTKLENAKDKDRHGTTVRHESHPNSKLTLKEVRAIRTAYATGNHTHRSLAKEYGVAMSLIGRIIRNESWPEKQGFFDDAVKRKYIHDSIHASVAYGDHPLYEDILVPGEEVMVDSAKFFAMDYETQLKLVREEVYATALERILIPANYEGSPGAAYVWALRRTITSLFKGEWALWAVLNYDVLARPDCKYMQRHLDNQDKLIRLETHE